MIAPVDAVTPVRGTQATARVPIPPANQTTANSSRDDENRLNAPLAHFEDGFSSDQGAFLSGAETEREVTPNTDREETPDHTPVWELPSRMATGAAQRPLYTTEAGGQAEDIGGGEEDDEHGDIVKTAKITISPPKELAVDEARASLLSHQHDSADMEMDETSSSSSPPLPTVTQTVAQAPISHQTCSLSRLDSNSPNSINQQLRQQYEIQAVSRPRPTTPVSACAIESFVAINSERSSNGEKMKISLPTSSFASSAAPETQPEDTQQTTTAQGSQKGHRRRSSMSWMEFQENMASGSYYTASGGGSGRASGRTTPLSASATADEHDLLEHNPFYQDRVPPSPVVHRRCSREWVDFTDLNATENGDGDEFKAPPLTELVTEIQQTVNAWSQNDYAKAEEERENTERMQPSEVTQAVSTSSMGTYGEQAGDQYYQTEPPPDPYDYGAYAPPAAQQEYATEGNAGFELESSYPPPPSPFSAAATSSVMDDWSSQAVPTSGTMYTAPVSGAAATDTQYVQPTHDDWDDSPYAKMQLSYHQQQLPTEPSEIPSQDVPREKAATPLCSAPPPPRPPVAQVQEESVPAGGKENVSEEWLAYERMTQKMNTVVKLTQEKLREMKKDTVAKMLPSTPYEVSIGAVSQTQQSTSDKRRSVVSPPPAAIDLLTSDFEPPPAVSGGPGQSGAATPQSSGSESTKEWKPIHEVLNDEIKKQKELQKPKRPPPPKAPPQRPPRPVSATNTAGNVLSSWDDTPSIIASSNAPSASFSAPRPCWDEGESAQASSHQAAVLSASPAVDTFPLSPTKHLAGQDASSVTRDPAATIAPTRASPIDYSERLGERAALDTTSSNALPFATGAAESVLTPTTYTKSGEDTFISKPASNSPLMEESIPFTKSDVTNQNHVEWNNQLEDDALFDVSKYSSLTAAKEQAVPAEDFDVFLKHKPTGAMPFPAPTPPIPPPRSPGPERMFVIEKDESHPVRRPAASSGATWADFESSETSAGEAARLPPSESEFYLKMTSVERTAASMTTDPFAPQNGGEQLPGLDLLGSVEVMEESYDPFAVNSPEQIVAEAKAKAQAQLSAREAVDDLDFFSAEKSQKSQNEEEEDRESPGFGFRDSFVPQSGENEGGEADDEEDGCPLYDEDDSQPLLDFPPKFTGDGWEMMLRFPVKKKMMAERCWKPVYVRLQGDNIELYYGKNDRLPFQTLPLLANYCLSDVTTQQYDIYGKIHTVKLQYVIYKEKVGIRPGQIPKLVEGHFTKLGLPLEHAAQTSVLLKFGSLHHDELQTFVYAVEDVLFHIITVRERAALYKQDEIQVHCYDEYASHVNKDGAVSDQRARVRLFCLSFVSGMPFAEIGLNDRRRQGKEVVRRKDIMPMYTERWIRFESLEFHSSVDRLGFDKEHVIRMQPLDACFFEVLRFRVRPPRGKELPLQVRSIMKLAGSKIEIRIEAMVAVFKSRKARQVPCEDIQIRFPIPEAWIYLFREERHWGYGSVHAKVRRPGKVKNIRDKIMGIVQNADQSLIEVAIGDAKYEHVYRSLVWRIPRLPEKHHGAYKTHLLRCRFELSSFDLMPETFVPNCEVEYTMPMATVSHTVVRSVSMDRHEDPDKVEKWVRYLAKYQYTVEIDYVQTTDLDIEAIMDTTVLEPEKSIEKPPVKHQPSLDVDIAKEAHQGYRIDFSEAELGGGRFGKSSADAGKSSSDSSDEDNDRKAPLIQIDIKNYQY